MRSIFSYDIILDAIRLVVDRGHVDFIETLAEEVATIVLGHPRVQSVRVNVQKLDVINGSVGVEIRRERAGECGRRAISRPGRRSATPSKDLRRGRADFPSAQESRLPIVYASVRANSNA